MLKSNSKRPRRRPSAWIGEMVVQNRFTGGDGGGGQ